MIETILIIVALELLFLFISFVGVYPIGIADRQDIELKFFRNALFIVFFISLNLITFLE